MDINLKTATLEELVKAQRVLRAKIKHEQRAGIRTPALARMKCENVALKDEIALRQRIPVAAVPDTPPVFVPLQPEDYPEAGDVIMFIPPPKPVEIRVAPPQLVVNG